MNIGFLLVGNLVKIKKGRNRYLRRHEKPPGFDFDSVLRQESLVGYSSTVAQNKNLLWNQRAALKLNP
jgi:hypothetical protein